MTANLSVHTEQLKEVAPPLLLLPDDELHAHHIQRPLLGNPDLAAYTGLAHRLVGLNEDLQAGEETLAIPGHYDCRLQNIVTSLCVQSYILIRVGMEKP